MKRPRAWNCALLATSTLCLITAPYLRAQTAPATTQAPEDDDTIVLSPFVVEADEDQGYQAKSTLAGTRVRTELRDIASSISVVTKDFLQDTGATGNESLLQYTTNTEVGGTWGNFSGIAGANQYNDTGSLLRPSNNTRVRGLDAADNTRDYFLTEIPWDGFNVDRVDLQRGPNSILFGVGSPAGIINTSVNTAGLKNRNVVENRVGSFGSVRFSADINYVIIPRTLSIRVAALDDSTKYQQKPAYNHDQRLFGAIRFSPKLFKDGANTLVRVNYEKGTVSANRPRVVPPVDAVSPWFLTGTDAYGNANLNKMTFNQSIANKGNAPYSNIPWLRNGAVGRQFWADVVGYYGNNNDSTPTDYRQAGPMGNRGIGPNGLPDNGIGGLPQGYAFAIASYSSYATATVPGGSFYADRSLADPSIYNFFDNLLDGDNKSEWQKWSSSNVAISQTFFEDRLGFEAVYDYQRYQDGQRVFLGNSDTYKIGVDINSHFIDGTANPNVGRAYVANSDEQANAKNAIARDSVRFTVTGDVRAEDYLDRESLLARLIGRHVFTGLVSEDLKRTTSSNWATSAATPEFTRLFGANDSLTAHFRSYDYVAYISDNLSSRSTAAGSNLQRVNSIIKAPQSANVRYFDNTWARSTVPGSANYVNPADPYSYNPQNFGLPGSTATTVVSTQSENPANYVGWRNVPVNFLNADNGDIDALTYNAQKQRNQIKSRAITWQGHLFDDAFVPVFGWRRDEVETSSASGAVDALGLVNTNFEIPANSRQTQVGESKSWGGVLRLPTKWAEKLPYGSNVSVFYNRSENFKADAPRGDVFGNVVPNPLGKTKEYGVAISTLNERVSLKATWYETTVANATLSGGTGLGQNGYFLWAVPAWGTAFVTNADQGLKGNNPNNAWAWNYANADTGESALPGTPAFDNHPSTILLKNAIEAWRQIPLEQSFFNAYGNEVALINVAAMRAGNWTVADPIWAQKFDNQPISGGLLAGFGSAPVTSVDTISKGVEFELAAQPTKNWNVAVNASKTFASRVALAPTIESYIANMTQFLAGPAGDIRLWGGGATNALRIQWQNNIINPYNTLIAQQGSNAPEIAPWRFNVISTYSFDEGKLKGFRIGGGYRWEQARVLGYQLKNVTTPSLTTIDIDKPLMGPDDSHLDLWFGYSRKITNKIHWRAQINLRNVGEDTKLVPVTMNPDGTVAFSRIQQGMAWQLTNTFEF